MLVYDKFNSLYNDILIKINNELDEVIKGTNKKNKQQLLTIIYEVEKMFECKNPIKFLPTYPRIIIDSWDFTDALGIELVNFFEIYKKL